jgi:hypothetical protein
LLVRFYATKAKELLIDLVVFVLGLGKDLLTLGTLNVGTILTVM